LKIKVARKWVKVGLWPFLFQKLMLGSCRFLRKSGLVAKKSGQMAIFKNKSGQKVVAGLRHFWSILG
jgi:hypothetical protein